ncbi:MAG: SpoIID/LytB domain-containing protein [Candidatus Aquicultorales bacterium]
MESGKPIGGAVVTMPEHGVRLVTDASGNLPSTSVSMPLSTEQAILEINAGGYVEERSAPRVYPGAVIKVTARMVSTTKSSGVAIDAEAKGSDAGLQGGSRADFDGDGLADGLAAYDYGGATTNLWVFKATTGIPQTVKVWRVSLNRVDVVPFEFYVKHVVPSEWIPSWGAESLKAGAMAAKTYAWYWVISSEKYANGADVRDDTYDQVYDPNYSHASTDAAVDATWNYKMTRSGSIFMSQYVAGSYGPGYDANYPGRLSQWGSAYWADQGKDWRWILRYYYGPTLGYWSTDIAFSSGDTLQPSVWWSSGAGNFDASRVVSWVIGNFNGDDYADAAALYDYGGTTAGILLFVSNGAGFNPPTRAFLSNNWSARQTKIAAGNFDGDSNDEIAAFYGYGGSSTGVFLFDSTGTSLAAPKKVYQTNAWDWTVSTLVPGDYDGNGVGEAGVVYDYGAGTTGIWTFPFTTGGSVGTVRRLFLSNSWNAGQATYLPGDPNNDGKADLVVPYNYGGMTTGVWLFTSTGSQLNANSGYTTPYWDYSASSFVTGDYTGDGFTDLLGIYRYGGSTTNAWLFGSTGASLTAPFKAFQSTYWNDWNARWIR